MKLIDWSASVPLARSSEIVNGSFSMTVESNSVALIHASPESTASETFALQSFTVASS